MKKNTAIIVIAAIFIVAAGIGVVTRLPWGNSVQSLSAAELLDLGEKYLLALDYEQAIVQFTKLIEFEPKNPRAYTGLAEAYVGLGNADKAIEVLRQGLEQSPAARKSLKC